MRPAEAAAAITRLRASQSLPAVSAAEAADPRALVIEERRRQLFSEGHRLGDMLRYRVPFPTGNNHKGQAYGPITCMPMGRPAALKPTGAVQPFRCVSRGA